MSSLHFNKIKCMFQFWFGLSRADFPMFAVSQLSYGKLQTMASYDFLSTAALFLVLLHKGQICRTHIKLSHLSCGTQQLLQTYHGLILPGSQNNAVPAQPVS